MSHLISSVHSMIYYISQFLSIYVHYQQRPFCIFRTFLLMRSAGSRPLVIYIQIQIWWSLLDFNPKPIEFKLKHQQFAMIIQQRLKYSIPSDQNMSLKCKCRSFWMKPCTSLWLNSPGKANLGVNVIFPLFLSMQTWYFKKITINCWTAFAESTLFFRRAPSTPEHHNNVASQARQIKGNQHEHISIHYLQNESLRVTYDYDHFRCHYHDRRHYHFHHHYHDPLHHRRLCILAFFPTCQVVFHFLFRVQRKPKQDCLP